ncbi:MAG: helix-turn-helix domain-containing protein [Angustibacter sp.]
MDKLLFTPREAAVLLGVGRSKVYEWITSGRLSSVKVDGCRRITRDALVEFVAALGDHEAA